MSVAAALAVVPSLHIHLRDESIELDALRGIALWAGQFTPSIGIAQPFGILLEISAVLTYFGGLDRLVTIITGGLRDLGWDVVLATSPTPAGSCLLARAGLQVHTREVGVLKKHLNALPLSFLAGTHAHADALHTLGIATIEDFVRLPPEGAARRFGQGLLDEIRRAAGDLPDPLHPFIPPEHYKNRIEFPAPVMETEALLFALKRLVIELVGFLRARGAGITRFAVEFIHEDAAPTRFTFGLTITRDAEHILRILRERLARQALPDRVEAVILESEETAPLDATNRDFFPGVENAGEGQTQLVERLRARLGDSAVSAIGPHADHRPELAWRRERTSAEDKRDEAMTSIIAARPLWLFAEPRRLTGDPATLSMTLTAGPERIESGWWDGDDVARDYFIAHNQRGEQCWVFRDRLGQWFVHGMFA